LRHLPARAALLVLSGALLVAGCGSERTDDDVVDAVPEDARAYVHLDRGAEDWDRAGEVLERLPTLAEALRGLAPSEAEGFTVPGGGEAGLAFLDGRAGPVVLDPDAEPVDPNLGGTRLYTDLVAGLPEQRFLHAYAGRAADIPLRELDASIVAAAAGADVDGDRMRVGARLAHEGEGGPCVAGTGGSELLDVADPDAALYLEVPSVACVLRGVAANTEGGLAALSTLERAAERRGGVSLDDELFPLLEHRGALIATPGDRTPTFTLIVDGVDEAEALDLLARLQPALIHLLQPGEFGQVPTFGSAEVRGITAATVQLAPGLELSYAAWDDRLVVSTSLAGIAQVRRAEGLPGSDTFDSVLGNRPSESSALVFLDLNQLLTLGEQAGLAEDPRYLAIRDDLQKLRAAGAVLSREENFTTAELTFQIP
jgi:hypothetical protein